MKQITLSEPLFEQLLIILHNKHAQTICLIKALTASNDPTAISLGNTVQENEEPKLSALLKAVYANTVTIPD